MSVIYPSPYKFIFLFPSITFVFLVFIFKTIENKLGKSRLNEFHSHFSKIEYTENGGEKRHLTFEDTVYGPEYEPLMELVYRYGISPTFICESAGTQGIDAKSMKDYYMNLR